MCEREKRCRIENLRSVKWRVDLGILPSSSSSSIDDFRRATADSRRRYARLRRRLLFNSHLNNKEYQYDRGPNNLVIDNPLSQNPDSTWGQFFRNAELEKMLHQDLSRLYPEHGTYFQTPRCQSMLRRLLLLWCLTHPDLGYRQGMHELLAPLLYVLHVDKEHHARVRNLYEDHFTDKFDTLSYHENDLSYNFDVKRFLDSIDDDNEDDIDSSQNSLKVTSLDQLDPEIQTIALLTDAYGAEGELGIVLSEKFMEHDAYCMFDALMSGSHGSVAMLQFFVPTPSSGLQSGLSPVIEASSELYYLLSVVDSSLYSHLVELGVEPQYFALRWLRVLFGREFSLNNLLIVWDEIFAADNSKIHKGVANEGFGVLNSRRGALISAMAVSMMLYLRSSLLATENATSCLQRLLNFPENINLTKIVEKAKSLQSFALDVNVSSSSSYHPFHGGHSRSKSMDVRSHTVSSDPLPTKTPLSVVPDSYWEEKWRAEQLKQNHSGNEIKNLKKGWTEKVKFRLSRKGSDPTPARRIMKETNSSVRRNLLVDLSQQLGLEENVVNIGNNEILSHDHPAKESSSNGDLTCTPEDRCFRANVGSEESSSTLSEPPTPLSGGANDHENSYSSEKGSFTSQLSADESYDRSKIIRAHSPLPISTSVSEISDSDSQSVQCSNIDSTGNSAKDKKLQLGKFHWLWKFGRNNAASEETTHSEETTQRDGSGTQGVHFSAGDGNNRCDTLGSAIGDINCCDHGKEDTVDQNVMGTFKNIGQCMLEHIQVIESVFQQDRLSKNALVGKGQVTAMTALSELRKISNILSEM
ncbi:hypothetical protein ACFE04_009889 [Oxalis oulophora]